MSLNSICDQLFYNIQSNLEWTLLQDMQEKFPITDPSSVSVISQYQVRVLFYFLSNIA